MTTVAQLEVVISANNNKLNTGLNQAQNKIASFASSAGAAISGLGQQMAMATAPLAAGLGVAIVQAGLFDQTMTNTAAVLGKSRDEMVTLNAEVLKLGGDSLAGPQAAAAAFYDVTGGISDATLHIPILTQAMALSEAGAADLGASTSALISVMNGYGFSANQAAFASDVMTQTVGKGVGTMDELAAALPQVTGLASAMGISFDDLGGAMAFLTTKGFSFSEASTQLKASITSLINPNADMKAALTELGFANGEAALKTLGLQGTMAALKDTSVASEVGIAKLYGSTEALNAAIALTDPSAAGFLDNFTVGLEGATEAAQAIQRDSPTATFALMTSKMSELSITAGNMLLPVLQDIGEAIIPIVDDVIEWMNANPQLAGTLIAIAGGAVILGPALMVVGTALSTLGTAFTLLSGPMLPVIIGFAGITAGVVALKALVDSGALAAGIEGWGKAIENAGIMLEVVFDRIKTGFTSFALDLELRLQMFVGALRQQVLDASGGTIDIDPNFNVKADALRTRIAETKIGDIVYDQLKAQIASGEPIDLTKQQEFTVDVGGASVTMPGSLSTALMDPEIIADLGVQGKMLIEDMLTTAFETGDWNTINLLIPVAGKMGIDAGALQAQVAADTAAVVAAIPETMAEDTFAFNAPVQTVAQVEVQPQVNEGWTGAVSTLLTDLLPPTFDLTQPVQTGAPTFDFSQGVTVDTAALKTQVTMQLIEAFRIGDQYTIDLLSPQAVALQVDVAQVESTVKSNIEAGSYAANITANIQVNSILNGLQNVPGLISDALAGFGAGVTDFARGIEAQTPQIPGFATGTPYVYKSGLAMIHEGEAVLTAEENAARRKSGKGGATVVQNFYVNSYGQSPAQLLAMLEKEARNAGR